MQSQPPSLHKECWKKMNPEHEELLKVAENRFIKIRTDLYNRYVVFKREIEYALVQKYQDSEMELILAIHLADKLSLEKRFKSEMTDLKRTTKRTIKQSKVHIHTHTYIYIYIYIWQ